MKNTRLIVPLVGWLCCPAIAGELRLDEFEVSEIASGWGQSRKNRSNSNEPLSIGGVRYTHGAGVHAPSHGYFLLGGGKTTFEAKVGVDDSVDGVGTVVFQVIADGETLFDSGTMRKGDAAKELSVDLTGREMLELRVTDAGDGRNFDHANWVDARFTYSDEPPRITPRWAMSVPHFKGDASALVLPDEVRTIASPDGSVQAEIGVSDGRLAIRATRNGTEVLAPSPLGVTVDGKDLGADAKLGQAESYTTNQSYEWIGNVSSLTDRCRGERIAVTSDGETWTLDVRAYDDGIAWRYVVPGRGTRKIESEATSFILPEGAIYWSHHNTSNYEANYLRFEPGDSAPTRPITMPVTVELKDDSGFASITEVDTMHYSGMTLGPRGRVLNGIFEDDPEGWTMQGEFASPWRVVIAVDDLDALVNQSIVYNVAPAPDPKLFPNGAETEWLRPGRSFWTWGFGQWDTAKWELIKGYVDDAASLNCEYYVIDDPWREPRMGWHRDGGDEWDSLKEVCEYAADKNVKIMVWEHWERLRSLEQREEFFRKVAEAGAVGVKIDFMDSESQERLEFYRSCLEIAAQRKILVNFHGSNKPAGEERTWPHGMTREGIYGMEQGGNIARQHMAALPFTRLVTGPGDFTPTVFRSGPMGKTTAGSQLAAAVAYLSPLHHWADSAESYLAQPEEVVDFIRSKPAVWDETRVLPGSRIGETAVLARRSGADWWISGINGTDEAADYTLDPTFLKAAREAIVFRDVAGEKSKLEISRHQLAPGKPLELTMQPGGGFVVIAREP